MLLYMLFRDYPINDYSFSIQTIRGTEYEPTVGTNNLKYYLDVNDEELNGILDKFNAINICGFSFYNISDIEKLKNNKILKKYNIKLSSKWVSENELSGHMLQFNTTSFLRKLLEDDTILYSDMKQLIKDIETKFKNRYFKFAQEIIFDNNDNRKNMQNYIFKLKNKEL